MTSPVSSTGVSTGFINNSATGTSSISGLASGMDTSSIISQLMQIAAQPQTLLKGQLSDVETDAAAYRDVNTSFAALQTAASQLTGTSLSSALTASSTDSSVTATATTGANVGNSVTFKVTGLASAQTVLSSTTWSSASTPLDTTQEPLWPLTVLDANGNKVGQIALPQGGTLQDAANAITNSGYGLSATVVQLDSSHFRLQVTGTKTGTANAFTLQSADETGTSSTYFTTSQPATDATLDLGGGVTATSSTDTFSSLLTGVSVTVSALTATGAPGTTVSVNQDNAGITSKVQALVDAANAALGKISQYTDSSSGSTAPLKGDWSLISLGNQIVDAVVNAVGSKTPMDAGLSVDKDGNIQFDSAAFSAKLASDPSFVTSVFGGTTGDGPDGVPGTSDDTIVTDGIGARLTQLAAQASDSTNGILTSLANGEDARATDLQSQISDWDTRLQMQQQTLTDQFNAMETALGTLKSQSSWLTSQINSLPGASSSSKSS